MQVSTHSRPKAAGANTYRLSINHLFQHTAARRRLEPFYFRRVADGAVSTHSRPKAAGHRSDTDDNTQHGFQHTAARRRLVTTIRRIRCVYTFQHTAARRRLDPYSRATNLGCRFNTQPPEGGWVNLPFRLCYPLCFNTQPPEGGWRIIKTPQFVSGRFNTQPPEGGWLQAAIVMAVTASFNTQPPEGGWR